MIKFIYLFYFISGEKDEKDEKMSPFLWTKTWENVENVKHVIYF